MKMGGRWNDDTLNCDFKAVHCKLDQFERNLQSVTDDVSEDMFGDKRSLEDRIDILQRELDTLENDGTSSRGREPYRTSSPGELAKERGRARSFQNMGRASQPRRSSSAGGCKCRCTAFLSDNRTISNPERDGLMQELRQELREVNSQKQELQEKMFALEEAQRLSDNDTQMLQSQLESDRVRCRQNEEENDELKEEIHRLEIAMSNLPVDDNGTMRETAGQITQLLQTLNDDMVKAPELCNRLRMAAQQIMEGEKRLTNERSTRAMDQAEVQFLRTENQRLRELAFRSNMAAFQASVQLPQNQMQYQQQLLGQPFGPGGSCADPYSMQQGQQGGPGANKRRGLLSRVFGKKDQQEDPGPGTIQYQDGSAAQFDPTLTMQQQRLSLALQEDPGEAARRVQMLNQEKRRSCCPR